MFAGRTAVLGQDVPSPPAAIEAAAVPAPRRRLPGWAVLAAIGAVAFAARLHAMTSGAGLGGISNYDDGVYFAAAQAFVSGRMPYRDFVLLHPPGIMLVLTPFAALARVLSDATAFELARLAFMLLGAVNAVLAAAVARRTSLLAAVVAGGLYALWPPALFAEVTTLLTPWNTLGLLVALVLLHRRTAGPRGEFLAGAALGLAAGVKIWGVVPLAVVVARQLAVAGRRSAARVALGAVAALGAVCLPFLAAAPAPMLRMVVSDQLGRADNNRSVVARSAGILGVADFGSGWAPPAWLLVTAAALLVSLAATGAVAERAWFVAALLVAVVGVLLTAPSYFAHYGAFAAGPLLVLAGLGTSAVARLGATGWRDRRRRGAWESRTTRPPGLAVAVLPVAVLPAAVLVAAGAGLQVGRPFPGRALGRAAAAARCVVSDNPVTLIEMDVEGRDLARGCRLWVDVTGLTYDTARARRPDGTDVPRLLNPVWQRAFTRYLLSADAIVLVRRGEDGLAPDTARLLHALPVIARVQGRTLEAVPWPRP